MKQKKELYKNILEFIIWLNDQQILTHPDIPGFIKGMKFLEGDEVSADPTLWIDWDISVNDLISIEDSLSELNNFIIHWANKYHMRSLKAIKYLLKEDDMDYNPEAMNKWNNIMKFDNQK